MEIPLGCGDDSLKGDTFSMSALHLAIKVPYFSNSGHTNEKLTALTFRNFWGRDAVRNVVVPSAGKHAGYGCAAYICEKIACTRMRPMQEPRVTYTLPML
eukprot:SAG31_NODE_3746_length_3928_cov_4.375555_5_plen_100_part_00